LAPGKEPEMTAVITRTTAVPATSGSTAHIAAHTFRAEWTKLRTLRSTWYTIGGAAFLSIGLGALICLVQVGQWDTMSAKQRLAFDPTSTALIGVLFASVILGSLAVRAITSEYACGMIRVTFAAIPKRPTVLAAKAAILAAVVFPVALLSNLAAFLVGSQILSSKHLGATLGQTGVIQAIVFGALAISVVAVIGLGLGGIIRHTAGATTAYQHDPAGTLIAQHIPGTGGDYYYVLDAHGSVIGLVNPAGVTRAAYGYDPYGGHPVATALNGTLPVNPWRYSGQYLDNGTGLYKMGARYYDPTLGRFTQQDQLSALADPANGNRYTYAGDDPINNVDPAGASFFGDALQVGSLVVAGAGIAAAPFSAGASLALTGASIGLGTAGTYENSGPGPAAATFTLSVLTAGTAGAFDAGAAPIASAAVNAASAAFSYFAP